MDRFSPSAESISRVGPQLGHELLCSFLKSLVPPVATPTGACSTTLEYLLPTIRMKSEVWVVGVGAGFAYPLQCAMEALRRR